MGVRLHVRSPWASGAEDEVVYEFDQERILIGRGRGADVCLPHRAVSVRHATIDASGNRYALVDHESTNGTRVAEARLVPGRPKPLRDSDCLEIGGFVIVFRSNVAIAAPTSSERTASLARRLVREATQGAPDELRPSFVVLNGAEEGRRVLLPDPPARMVVGRGEECDVVLEDADASREHAELDVSIDGVRVCDLDSKNGVLVGGRAVRERLLDDRDELRIGATMLLFEDPARARVRELEQGDDAPPDPPRAALPVEAPVDPADEAEPPPPEPPPPPRPRATIAPADMVIYVLASVVFAVSMLGLLWLLRA